MPDQLHMPYLLGTRFCERPNTLLSPWRLVQVKIMALSHMSMCTRWEWQRDKRQSSSPKTNVPKLQSDLTRPYRWATTAQLSAGFPVRPASLLRSGREDEAVGPEEPAGFGKMQTVDGIWISGPWAVCGGALNPGGMILSPCFYRFHFVTHCNATARKCRRLPPTTSMYWVHAYGRGNLIFFRSPPRIPFLSGEKIASAPHPG